MSLQLPAPSASERRPVAEARPGLPVEPHDGRWPARIWAAASGAVGTVAGCSPTFSTTSDRSWAPPS